MGDHLQSAGVITADELSREDAVFLCESKFWEPLTAYQRAKFQLFQERLCMPFDVFHAAITECLGRPVYTHEFASSNAENMKREFLGEIPAPTFGEVLAMIPADKRIVIRVGA